MAYLSIKFLERVGVSEAEITIFRSHYGQGTHVDATWALKHAMDFSWPDWARSMLLPPFYREWNKDNKTHTSQPTRRRAELNAVSWAAQFNQQHGHIPPKKAILTIEQLKQARACGEAVELFESQFGESVEVTVDLAIQQCELWNWSWASNKLLSKEGRKKWLQRMEEYDHEEETFSEMITQAALFAEFYINENIKEISEPIGDPLEELRKDLENHRFVPDRVMLTLYEGEKDVGSVLLAQEGGYVRYKNNPIILVANPPKRVDAALAFMDPGSQEESAKLREIINSVKNAVEGE